MFSTPLFSVACTTPWDDVEDRRKEKIFGAFFRSFTGSFRYLGLL
jgi:hypothetical protein